MNFFDLIKKQSEKGNLFYLVAFTVNIDTKYRTASFLYKSEKEVPLLEVYLKVHEQEELNQFKDQNGILTITNIQKL